MSLFEELKRRNVFRVGIAYAISAWVLLQIVDLVLDNISTPDWIMQVFMLFVAIGFPIALIFAWAFEMTADGVKLEKHVDRSKSITQKTGQKMNRNISIALAVAVVFLLVDRFTPESDTATLPPEDKVASIEPVAEAQESEKSIAVLPFVDMSPEGDQAYFADGISEEILNVLVKTQSLKVAGRTSSFQFRDGNKDLKEIGEQLGVAHLLEGSIRKANNRVRITAQLVTANDGFHLWSETYDRELTDIFAIQDEIARAITKALAIELNLENSGQSLVTASTSNMDAYDRYLEAKGLIARRLDFPRAIALLEEATQLDPNFAAGWAAGAQAHTLAYYYIVANRDEHLSQAEIMANNALKIEPNLSEAHSVLGDVYRDRSQWMQAKKSYLRALALNPDDVEANEQYAQMLWRANFIEEALVYSSKATELDPLSWLNLTVHACLRYASGDRTGAWTDMDQVMKLSGGYRDFPLRHAFRMAITDDNLERAIGFMNDLSNTNMKKFGNPKVKARFEEFIPKLHSKEETLAFITAGQTDYGVYGFESTWEIEVFWAAYYGDFDLAEAILSVGVRTDNEYGDIHDTSWLNYEVISKLRNTEAYKQLVRSINLDDFWRESGFPDSCRPLGEDDFACN